MSAFTLVYRGIGSTLKTRSVANSPVALHRQHHEGKRRADDDNEENAADVLDADSVTLVLYVRTVQLVSVPPCGLHLLQLPLVDQLQNPAPVHIL